MIGVTFRQLGQKTLQHPVPMRLHMVEEADARCDIGRPVPSRSSLTSILVSLVLRATLQHHDAYGPYHSMFVIKLISKNSSKG